MGILVSLVITTTTGFIFPPQFEEMLEESDRNKSRRETNIKNQELKIKRDDESTECGAIGQWCNDVPEYPEKNMTYIIHGQKTSLINKFFDDLLQIKPRSLDTAENICETKTNYITPRGAKNKEGKFMFIVNHPEGSLDYVQLVRVTTCTTPDEECAQGQLSGSISTRCHQEYSDHKLVALSESGEELVVDTFSFPSCCSCVFDQQMEL